jgi:AcrR family transcriptional regulator
MRAAERREGPWRPGKPGILAAARNLYARNGVAGVSMRKVGRAAGVTPMAIYRHYPNKDAVLEGIAAEAFRVWERRLERIAARDPLVWLRRAARAYLDFALEDPRNFHAAFLLTTRTTRRFPEDFAAGRSPGVRMVAARMAECLRRAGRDGDALEMAMTLWAMGHGFIVFVLDGRFSGRARALRSSYARAIDVALRGLGLEP